MFSYISYSDDESLAKLSWTSIGKGGGSLDATKCSVLLGIWKSGRSWHLTGMNGGRFHHSKRILKEDFLYCDYLRKLQN